MEGQFREEQNEQEQQMLEEKRARRLTRICIPVIAFVICNVYFMIECKNFDWVIGVLFCIGAYVIALITTPISKFIVKIGDRIQQIGLRVLYYLGVFLGDALAFGAVAYILVNVILVCGNENDMWSWILRIMIWAIATLIIGGIFIVPYIETILYLLIRSIMRSYKVRNS